MPIKSFFECDECSFKKGFTGDVRKAFNLLEEKGWSLSKTILCPNCNTNAGSKDQEEKNYLEICSDGSCVGSNPGYGGWGWVSPKRENSGPADEYPTTNQRMEILAATRALEENQDPVLLYTDSQYVAQCFNKKWYLGWQRNGWKNASRQPVKNQDLWERFVRAIKKHPNLKIVWVKGHKEHALNVQADKIANKAAHEDMTRRNK